MSSTTTIASPVELNFQQDVAVITLNRTNRRNALTSEARLELTAAIERLSEDQGVRAIVFASRDSAFSSGQDLAEAKDFPPEFIPEWIKEHMDLYKAVLRYPRPMLAAIDGCCVGAGFQTALLCDLRFGSASAYFAMPELEDAIPCILGTWTLWDIIGRARTSEMVLTNRSVGAEEALAWGILNRLVPSREQLLAQAIEMALHLAGKPELAWRLTKQRLADLALRECDSLAVHASCAHIQAFASGEPRQAMLAFLEGRRMTQPSWLAHSQLSTLNGFK
jgi:enoyl-CoA hydratase/carnithine racemase